MPEGDTIHKAAGSLAPVLVGRRVVRLIDRGLPRAALAGATVQEVEARGKHILITLDLAEPARSFVVHVHLGMHGRQRIVPATAAAALPRGTSLVIVTADHAVAYFHAPVVEILRAPFAGDHPVLARLGPDLLAPAVPLGEIVRRARAVSPPDRPIAEVLLDQRIAAGIGNVYKSEILFLERLAPLTPIGRLEDAALARLFALARDLLAANVRPGPRITKTDGRGGRFWTYGRRGRPCFRCGTAIDILRSGDAARSTYVCPRCQRAPVDDAPGPLATP